MGKYVNVVLPGGKTVAVTEEEAVRLGDVARRQTDQERAQSAVDERNEAHFSQPIEKLKTFAEGVVDTATAGGYGKVAAAVDEDYGERMRMRGRTNPGTRFAAELATTLAPSGLLGKGAKEVGALTAEGLFNRAGEAVGGKLGRVVEGGLSGVAGYSAQTNVTGDQLTIEGAVEGAGIGSLLTLGLGALGDGFKRMGKKAAGKTAEAEELAKHFESLKANEPTVKALFDETPSSYTDARLANDAWQKQQRKAAAGYAKEAAAYEKFTGSNSKLTIAIKKTEGVINDIEKRWHPRPPEPAAIERIKDPTAFDVSDVESVEPANPRGKPMKPVVTTTAGDVRTTTIPAVEAKPAHMPEGFDVSDVTGAEASPEGGVISEATKAKLDGYRARISELYKAKGGGWRIDGGRWVPDASVKADPAGVTEELRRLNDEIQQAYPKASGKLADLPAAPSTPIVHSEVKLPETLRGFIQKHPGSVDKLVASMDPATMEAFGRLAEDLGVSKLDSPADTVKAVHEKLKAVASTWDKASALAKAKGEKAADGLMGWMQTFARGAASLALGRTANRALGGGWMGAIGQVGASNAARSIMHGAESSLQSLDNAMVASKEGIRGKVRSLIAKYGEGAGAATTKLGPVTAYLSQSFPFAEPDTETDLGRLAVKRIEEVTHAATTAPDALYLVVEGMLGHPGDIGWKVHAQLTGALNYLLSKAPKDPGIDVTMFKSNWTPSRNDLMGFAHTMEAIVRPMDALDRALQGDGHPAAIEALWNTMPATMSEFGAELAANADKFEDLPIEQASNFSRIFRRPMTPLQEPAVIAQLQGMYLPRPVQPGAPQSSPGGRPPAVNSRVAGSSVAGLIS